MNLIKVITTKGCVACSILQDTLSKTLKELNRSDINVEYIDCQDLSHRQFINRYMITDFPTMVFIKDNEVLIKYTGTKPKYELNKISNQQFKV